MYLPEIFNHIQPETVVMLTLRDPKAWYKSRTSQKFGAEKLCRKELWDSGIGVGVREGVVGLVWLWI